MTSRITLTLIWLFSFLYSKAQVANEEVHFDFYQDAGNNDFVNHFSGGYGLSQIQTNGITGGCLITPDSISWGNDNAIYCSRYKPVIGDTLITSISFKYDSALVHPSSFQRAMSIWLTPLADFNHYIIATVAWNKKIELLTYSWNNNPYPPLALHSNHWYRYVLSVIFISSQQLSIEAEVFDLGTSGTGVPLSVNSSSGMITDNVLASDTSIQVSITGAAYGGATYLDDFQFEGRLGMSDCINIPTGITAGNPPELVNVYPNPSEDEINIELSTIPSGGAMGKLYGVSSEIMTFFLSSDKTKLDIHSLPSGVYYLYIFSEGLPVLKPVLVARNK